MKVFIFAFFTMLLLIPIIYILPLGLNKKGKLVIIGVSFVLAVIGLIANLYYQLWQTLIMLFGLALIVTYFIEKKLRTMMLKSEDKLGENSYIHTEESQTGDLNGLKLKSEPDNEIALLSNDEGDTKEQDIHHLVNETNDNTDETVLSKEENYEIPSYELVESVDTGNMSNNANKMEESDYERMDEINNLDDEREEAVNHQLDTGEDSEKADKDAYQDVIEDIEIEPESVEKLETEEFEERKDWVDQVEPRVELHEIGDYDTEDTQLEQINNEESQSDVEWDTSLSDLVYQYEQQTTRIEDRAPEDGESMTHLQDESSIIEDNDEKERFEQLEAEAENVSDTESNNPESMNAEPATKGWHYDELSELLNSNSSYIDEASNNEQPNQEVVSEEDLNEKDAEEELANRVFNGEDFTVEEQPGIDLLDKMDQESADFEEEGSYLDELHEIETRNFDAIFNAIEEAEETLDRGKVDFDLSDDTTQVERFDEEEDTTEANEEKALFEDDVNVSSDEESSEQPIINESELQSSYEAFSTEDGQSLDNQDTDRIDTTVQDEDTIEVDEIYDIHEEATNEGSIEEGEVIFSPEIAPADGNEQEEAVEAEIVESNESDNEIPAIEQAEIDEKQGIIEVIEENNHNEAFEIMEETEVAEEAETVEASEEAEIAVTDVATDSETDELDGLSEPESDDEHEDLVAGEETQQKATTKTKLQQQMFHMMVSELHLSRELMPANEYEQLVKEHLHPDLSEQDYYTFAHLLIEHYIEEENYIALASLLTELRGRLEGYPILLEEIDFLYDKYCGDRM